MSAGSGQLSGAAGVGEGVGGPRSPQSLEGRGMVAARWLLCPGILGHRGVPVRDFGSGAGFSRCREHVRPLYPGAAPRCPLGTNFAFCDFSVASPCGSAGNRANLNLWLCLLSLRSVFPSSVQFSNQRLKAGGVNHGARTPSLST